MSIRVVYLSHCARLSGAELALASLLPELEDVEAHVILAEDGPLVDRLETAGATTEVLPFAQSVRELPKARVQAGALPPQASVVTAAYTLRLARRLRRLRPSLVHANSLKALVYGAPAARLARAPLVWHVHDRMSDDYLPATAIRLLGLLAARSGATVIAPSRSVLDTLPPAVRSRGTVIYPMVRAPEDEPIRSRNGTAFAAGVVGRIAPWKGQHVFLDAFARAFPGGPERGVVIGAPLFGEDAYEHELRARCSALGLDGRIEFAGFRDDIHAELARLDALVHTSVMPEPFGNAIAEGMASGLPVVAAGAGGPLEYVEHGVNGYLYRPGNADELASLLTRLATNPLLRRRLGRAARSSVGRFAPDVIARQTTRFYLQTLGASL